MNSPFVAKIRPLLPLLVDIVVPILLYVVLKQVGLNDFWALTVAGVGTGVVTAVNTVRRRRLDFVGILVILEIILSVALLFTTNDPRVVAVKPAFYTALAGLFMGCTCFVGRPVVYQAAAPMAIKGDPVRAVAYDRAWDGSAEFRRRQRLMTAAFAGMLLVESAARVYIVYHYSIAEIEKSFLLSQVPGIVLIVFVLGYFRLQVPALRRIVDAFEDRNGASDAPARTAR
ncbi:VC0807 family protein [Microbispora sp. NPDC049125]|uniref:VC0807 family protein n=1 Tax=Microbispora sp. NPDC049125 TaxID=3154929 RepID=UPI003465D59D